MELQITTLIENMQDDAGELICEHGLSLYIEFAGRKILFDTGQTGEFLPNARKLGKNVADVDYIVISHGHYDHSGGVVRLVEELQGTEDIGGGQVLQCAKDTGGGQVLQSAADGIAEAKGSIPMYVGEEFFHKKYKHLSDGSYRYNGNSFTEADLPGEKVALRKVTADVTYLEENIILFKNFKRVTDFEKLNLKFVVERGGGLSCEEPLLVSDKGDLQEAEVGEMPYMQDDFRDELALGLRTSKGLVVVVGCSHVGIVNILQTIAERTGERIYSVLGGTHLVEADEERLDKTLKALRNMELSQIAVSHCTGEPGMEQVAQEFGADFVKNNTGHVYIV